MALQQCVSVCLILLDGKHWRNYPFLLVCMKWFHGSWLLCVSEHKWTTLCLRAFVRVCVNYSQLCGVLGNALGQSVQPSVAASHHTVWACTDVRATRRRKATIILHTYEEKNMSGGFSEVEQWPISKMDIVQNEKQSIRDWKGKREWDKIRDRHWKGRREREEVNRGNDWTASEAHGQFHSSPHSALLNCSLLSASNDHWPLKPAK